MQAVITVMGRLWAAILLLGVCGPARAEVGAGPAIMIRPTGPAAVLFDPARQGCDGNDVPDAPARALRDAGGLIRVFGLHYTNHFLAGRSFGELRIVCDAALSSGGQADPARYDDKSWIAATWTRDGRIVDGLVHHEFQADSHPGLCRFPSYMQCWFNTVLAVRSTDGGAHFAKPPRPVVASAPFRQDVDQGRHRGFFNPSNIVSDGKAAYFLASTTGWTGQDSGVCLFRSLNPDDPQSWRAFDGQGFTIAYRDPYGPAGAGSPRPCAPLRPFPAPVGSVVRQRGSGLWVAVFQAAADAGRFPVSGFYASSSTDLVHWSAPRLVVAGTTNYEDPCRSGGSMIAYPSLIDPEASGRNFDDVGSAADLFYARIRVDGCTMTADRAMVRQPVALSLTPN